MDYTILQQYWWFLVSLLGALLVFLLFVQGANRDKILNRLKFPTPYFMGTPGLNSFASAHKHWELTAHAQMSGDKEEPFYS